MTGLSWLIGCKVLIMAVVTLLQVQYVLVRLLCATNQKLFVVGDVDQVGMIYSCRIFIGRGHLFVPKGG